MTSHFARAWSLLAVTGGVLLAACGGQLFGDTSSGGGGRCVTIDPSTYDQSCQTAADCMGISSGQICSGECACGGQSAVNVSEGSRYDQALSSIQLAECFCPAGPEPQCVNNTCTLEGQTTPEAGPSPEAGVCVDIELSSFDPSCQVDSDCIDITTGTICKGQCACGGSAVNVSGEAAYEQALASLGSSVGCPCPFGGQPRCLSNHCALCGVGLDQPAGCPDGGQ
jgi:hypothetical protein